MADRTPLPPKAELKELQDRLLAMDEETDEVTVSITLRREGVDRAWLADALKTRMERRVAEIRERGEEVPAALDETLSVLRWKAESGIDAQPDPEAWIDSLLSGRDPRVTSEADRGEVLHSFRSPGDEFLTEKDLQILEDFAAELRSQSEQDNE